MAEAGGDMSKRAMLQPWYSPRSAGASLLLGLLLASAFAARGSGPSSATTPTGDWTAFQKTVQPFLAKHCFACHDQTERGGGNKRKYERQYRMLSLAL